jgi:hypothetical protein
VVPALRDLLVRAPPAARPALEATIAKLGGAKASPPAKAKVKAKAKAKKSGKAVPDERELLTHRLEDAGFGAARARDLVALARSRILIKTRRSRAKEVPLGASRLGGLPDLPRGLDWPEVDGQPMEFVGQLDLAELAPFDVDHLLPSRGVLSFFLRDDVTVDDRGDLMVLASRVLHFADATELAPRKAPPALDPGFRTKPSALAFARDRPLPPPAIANRLGLVLSEMRAYDTLTDDAPYPHASLGWARAAYFRGLPRDGETLLLQLRRSVVDAFYVIPDDALAAGRFDQARCLADEC